MKARHVLVTCLLPAMMMACKKDDKKTTAPTAADNSLRFTLDGKTYNTGLMALSTAAVHDNANDNQLDSAYTITALSDSSASAGQIVLSITFKKGLVKTGNYGDTAYAADGISWTPEIGKDDFYQSSTKNYSVITVTRADSQYVEGTFDGDVVATTDENKISKISGGQFKINITTVAKGD